MQNKGAYNLDAGRGHQFLQHEDNFFKDDTPMKIIPEQLKLDTPLLPIIGNIDYNNYQAELEFMDELCCQAGIDEDVTRFLAARAQQRSNVSRAKMGLPPKCLKDKVILRLSQNGRTLFRAALLRKYIGESLRVFCCGVAESPLRQRFCRINRFVEAKIFSKSVLGDFENNLPADYLKKIHGKLLLTACGKLDPITEVNQFGLATPVSIDHCYADTTCVQANIHFPVDWLLLRDATRTTMKAVDLIRNAGLRHRMPCEPKEFREQVNSLCMQMAQCRRKKDSRKLRKKILRLMKQLLRRIAGHAERHAKLLEEYWGETDYSEMEAKAIIDRIRNILQQLPAAIFHAHERIIGERRIPNAQKILSLYEDELHVIVRGKAGGETEFGNTLMLVEQSQGLIVDYNLLREKSPGDPTLLAESIDYIESIMPNMIKSMATDRGFDSPDVRQMLESKNIFNAVCPRSIPAYIERSKDPQFRSHQKRRAQTEARIAILNGFSSNPQLQKGFAHREIHMGLSVLSHNLRKLAQLQLAQQARPPSRVAA